MSLSLRHRKGDTKIRALILSAGLGTRLKPLTDDTPKPLIEVGGKPIIQHLIEKLWKAGVYQIIVNMHHLPLKMIQVEGVLFSYEKELLGEEGTIMNLRDWLNGEPFFAINGDTLSEVDYRELVHLYHQHNVLIRHIEDGVFAGTALYPNNWFTRMSQVPHLYRPGVRWIDIGTPEGLEKAREMFTPEFSIKFEYERRIYFG